MAHGAISRQSIVFEVAIEIEVKLTIARRAAYPLPPPAKPRDISKHLQLLILTVCIDDGPGMALSTKKRAGKGADEEKRKTVQEKKERRKEKKKEKRTRKKGTKKKKEKRRVGRLAARPSPIKQLDEKRGMDYTRKKREKGKWKREKENGKKGKGKGERGEVFTVWMRIGN
jgi:hypothetical protein